MIDPKTILVLVALASCGIAWQSFWLAIQMRRQERRDRAHEQVLARLARHAEALTERLEK
jgi:hypothetical protein